jgi:hypothetical protein
MREREEHHIAQQRVVVLFVGARERFGIRNPTRGAATILCGNGSLRHEVERTIRCWNEERASVHVSAADHRVHGSETRRQGEDSMENGFTLEFGVIGCEDAEIAR